DAGERREGPAPARRDGGRAGRRAARAVPRGGGRHLTRPAIPASWDETVDVVIAGSGYAGAVAAIAAHDAGASVALLEKLPDPGGISICSAGGVRIADDAEAALRYLVRTNGGTTPEAVLRTLAE